MSRITVDSKCFKTPADVLIYETEKQRVENQVPSSTVAHNTVAASRVNLDYSAVGGRK